MSVQDLTMTFGPLAPFMADNEVEEVWINSPERIFIARAGKNELTNLLLSGDDVRNIVERALMWSGRRLDLSHPFVDARLPDGSRLHVAIPEITPEHWAVNIRKHLMRNLSLRDLASRQAMSSQIAQLLANSVHAGINILVSGGTQAGKTTMLNALVSAIPVYERVITIEEVFELKPNLPDIISLQTRSPNLQGEGEIPLRRLIKESLRMRPSRIIVGEVREAEALDLLIAHLILVCPEWVRFTRIQREMRLLNCRRFLCLQAKIFRINSSGLLLQPPLILSFRWLLIAVVAGA
jgi:pilus assembly protein CpaF